MLALLPVLVALAAHTDFAGRAAKLEGKKDAKAWMSLADFAEDRRLWPQREQALRKVLEIDPGNAPAHERLGEARSGSIWIDADEADEREIREQEGKGLAFYGSKWLPPKEAGRLREADRKAAGWPLEIRMDTPHFIFYSSKPLAFTRRLAALLESEVGTYRRIYATAWRLDADPFPLKVFVYGDRRLFLQTARKMTPLASDETGGFYSRLTQILYVSSLLDTPEADLCVAAHELLHALDNRWARCDVPQPPLWILEGRAIHLCCAVKGRGLLSGTIRFPENDGTISDLRKAFETESLPALLAMDSDAFMKNPGPRYAMSWAVVEFLLYGEEGKHAAGFMTFLKGLPAKGSIQALEAAVGRVADWEPAFRRFAEEEILSLEEAP